MTASVATRPTHLHGAPDSLRGATSSCASCSGRRDAAAKSSPSSSSSSIASAGLSTRRAVDEGRRRVSAPKPPADGPAVSPAAASIFHSASVTTAPHSSRAGRLSSYSGSCFFAASAATTIRGDAPDPAPAAAAAAGGADAADGCRAGVGVAADVVRLLLDRRLEARGEHILLAVVGEASRLQRHQPAAFIFDL